MTTRIDVECCESQDIAWLCDECWECQECGNFYEAHADCFYDWEAM